MNFQKAEFVISYGLSSQIPPSKNIEIVFAGRSNVGKSSAINKIFNRKNLARVSCVPGKTATINFYKAGDIHFVDLPGYGYAKVSKSEKIRWSELIEGYFASIREISIVILLLDIRHKPSNLDIQMINFLIDNELPLIILLTKSDKLGKTKYKNRLEELKLEIPEYDSITIIPFSSENGEGVAKIRDIIEQQEEYAASFLEEI